MTRGPRVVGSAAREEMKRILAEIQSGEFAREWVQENRDGLPNYHRLQQEGAQHQIEKVGAQLRSMMPFLASGGPRPQDVSGG